MVKRIKDKQHQSTRELSDFRSQSSSSHSSTQKRLPFGYCALSLTPVVDPVCTPEGVLLDAAAVTPFVLQHGKDPVTGGPLSTKDLIVLHMTQESDDETTWICPILQKPLTHKVIAIKHGSEANVYSYQAYYELNVKPKNWEDLVSGEPFDKNKDGA